MNNIELTLRKRRLLNKRKITEALQSKNITIDSKMNINEIRALLNANQVKLGCNQGDDFCIECGVNEIERYS